MSDAIDMDAISPYLRTCAQSGASDLHLKAESQPKVRISGRLVPLDAPILTGPELERMIFGVMPASAQETLRRTGAADFAISADGIGRFRGNAYRAKGNLALVLRKVIDVPPGLTSLGVPPMVARLALEPRGLVLVTGPTGSGKTTTLSAMVDLINSQREVHILTLEDPIEVLHGDKRASVSQRELGTDTDSFSSALRAAMREDPDVILIGEMRDPETVSAALSAAETGHLVMSTMHTTDSVETINRIIDFFPPHQQQQTRAILAQSLRGVICQRLLLRQDGQGRVPAMEIMVNSVRIAEAITDPEKTYTIADIVAESGFDGMQSFDGHLLRLVLDDVVNVDEAKSSATSRPDFVLSLRQAGLDPAMVGV